MPAEYMMPATQLSEDMMPATDLSEDMMPAQTTEDMPATELSEDMMPATELSEDMMPAQTTEDMPTEDMMPAQTTEDMPTEDMMPAQTTEDMPTEDMMPVQPSEDMSATQPAQQTTRDPVAMVGTDRATILGFLHAQAGATTDMATTLTSFQEEIATVLQLEEQFGSDLVALSSMLNTTAIKQTATDLQSTESSIESSFEKVLIKIQDNNLTAAALSAAMASASTDIDTIRKTRIALVDKVSSYQNILSTFRSYSSCKIKYEY